VCGVNRRPALRLNDGDEISARPVGVGAVSQPWILADERAI